MNLLDKNGILDLRNYDKDFNWRKHENIIPKIKGFNIKGYKHRLNFEECNLFNDDGIDFLDLSEHEGKEINFFDSNIKFKKISVKNSLGRISFHSCENLQKVDYLDLSEFKGKYIVFNDSKIGFKEINVKNSLGEISFHNCKKINKVKFLDLSEFKGNYIHFDQSNINFSNISVKNCYANISFMMCSGIKKVKYLDLSYYKGDLINFLMCRNLEFEELNLINNKAVLNFNLCKKLDSEVSKRFDLKNDFNNENAILLKYHSKENLLKIHESGRINLTKLKHQTELIDIYNFLKNHIKTDNDFDLFESLISFKHFNLF